MMKLIERLQKILAMTESPNENEAANAAAMAAEIMHAHNLTYSDLRECSEGGGKNVTAFFMQPELMEDWRTALASKIAKFSGCDYLAWNKRKNMQHVLVGEPAAIAGAVVMYEYLRDACHNCYSRMPMRDQIKLSFRSYASGFTTRVIQRIEEKMSTETMLAGATHNALVVQMQRIKGEQNAAFIRENFGGGGETLPVRGVKDDLVAFERGVKAGDVVGLDRQIDKSVRERLK